jgi:hypothetical protein
MGKILKKDILKLKPTQFAIGFEEVDDKVNKLLKMTSKQRKKHQETKVIPGVFAPDGNFYIIDHHHAARACWEIGLKKVNVYAVADYRNLSSMTKFWEHMETRGWVYPFSQFGKQQLPYELLPQDVRGLADDPYRGLAWAVKEASGFPKSEVPFFEFAWANYFRAKIPARTVRQNFDLAVRQAVKLCKTKKGSI